MQKEDRIRQRSGQEQQRNDEMSKRRRRGLESLILRTKPIVLEFSLYFPFVEAKNYRRIQNQVLQPVQHLLCDHGFFLLDAYDNAEEICRSQEDRDKFDANDPHNYYGSPEHSVLLQAPIWVRDEIMKIPEGSVIQDPHSRGIGNGRTRAPMEVPFTGWRILFYVLQLGQPYIDMAYTLKQREEGRRGLADFDFHNLTESYVAEVMTNVLQLALDVAIEEEDMDKRMSIVGLPTAKMSVPGREIRTWTVEPTQQIPTIESSGDDISNFTQTLPPILDVPTAENSHTEDTPRLFGADQTFAMRMVGGTLLFLVLFVVLLLHTIGRRRRFVKEREIEIQRKKRALELELGLPQMPPRVATEDDLSLVLRSTRHGSLRRPFRGAAYESQHPAKLENRNGRSWSESSSVTTLGSSSSSSGRPSSGRSSQNQDDDMENQRREMNKSSWNPFDSDDDRTIS